MDAAKLDFPDECFDAVFDFGIIHHIPDWRRCLREVHRVLKPGGELLLEELSRETFAAGSGRLWRRILDHPYDHMFAAGQFAECLIETGFSIRDYRRSNPLGLLRHFSLAAVRN